MESPQPTAPPPPPQPTPVQQTPPQRRGLRTGCLIVGVIFLGVLAAGAYFGWRFINDEILPGVDEATEVFTPLDESPPGPCFDVQAEGGVLTDWTEVSCDGPRQVEVTFAAGFEDGPFPGDQYLVESAEDTCLNAFETYVGISPEQSRYDYDFLLPTEEMWDGGRRNGICLVVADDGSTLTGLVKGSET